MSKSLKNFYTAREILDVYDAEAIRFFFLSKHYRSPIDFSQELMQESSSAVRNFYAALEDLDWLKVNPAEINLPDNFADAGKEFEAAMDDDFNTAKALAVLFDLTDKIRSDAIPRSEKLAYAKLLVELGSVLGFFQDLNNKLAKTIDPALRQKIETLIAQRNIARQNKDWAAGDRIREELIALGVEIKDTKDGTVWKLK